MVSGERAHKRLVSEGIAYFLISFAEAESKKSSIIYVNTCVQPQRKYTISTQLH